MKEFTEGDEFYGKVAYSTFHKAALVPFPTILSQLEWIEVARAVRAAKYESPVVKLASQLKEFLAYRTVYICDKNALELAAHAIKSVAEGEK